MEYYIKNKNKIISLFFIKENLEIDAFCGLNSGEN